ncbi:CLCA_X family protein [Shewanella sp.]|uniref:CLCA_X family protein n=1 Tax=Shewanella sp. TaxID=50422 RepID=UPI003A97C415
MLANSQYFRSGPDYRFDDAASFSQIRDTFGFASVRVGKWVTDEEAEKAANLLFDALADLAFILNVPPATLGLRQKLNLDFGIGGRPGVQAHYAPQTRTLALAKNAGTGALAHEFWHALDHHLADTAFVNDVSMSASAINFATDLWLKDRRLKSHPVNQALELLLREIFLQGRGQDANSFVTQAISLDKQMNRDYFAMPTELGARAFEACIESSAEITNRFLVQGTLKQDEQTRLAYPTLPHRARILQCLRQYFQCLADFLPV